MRKVLILFVLSVAMVSQPLLAQKHRQTSAPKAPALTVLQKARKAIEAYDFEHAAQLLTTEIEVQNRKRKPTANTDSLEALLDVVQGIATKLHATERIIVIDSVVCPKEQALKAIRLTRESGRIDTYASTYHTLETSGATIYENELGNKRYLALPAPSSEKAQKASSSKKSEDADSVSGGISTKASTPLRLAVSDKIGDSWSTPLPLTSLGEDDISQNFPFLLSDGVTLYYAAKGPESIGGYDIFVTRADGEDGSFLTPENVGFPFNSPSNDYLFAIDELAQLGWFVTDRRQPEGQVCVYTFIPNDTREVYGDEISEEQLRSLARLTSIRDTWGASASKGASEDKNIRAAQQRLADLRAGKPFGQVVRPDFVFVIDDTRTYTCLADFRSFAAKEKMLQYQQLSKNVETDATMLQRLRDNYTTAQPAQRQQLAETIRRLETTYYPNLQHLEQLAKEIRNAEISNK